MDAQTDLTEQDNNDENETRRTVVATTNAYCADTTTTTPKHFTATASTTTTTSIWQCLHRVWEKGELYRGVTPIVLTIATSNFIFFWVQSYLRQWKLASRHFRPAGALDTNHTNKNSNKNPHSRRSSASSAWAQSLDTLVASTLGGILNVLLTNPLWVTNLRIVTGQATHASLHQELHQVIQSSSSMHDLVSQLWKGTGSSLLLVSNPVLQWICYEQIRTRILSSSTTTSAVVTLSPTVAFWTGAASKAISTILTYPLQLTQAVLRIQSSSTNTTGASSSPPDQWRSNKEGQFSSNARTTTADNRHSSDDRETGTDEASRNDEPNPNIVPPLHPNPSSQPSLQRHHIHSYRGTLDCLRQLYQRHGLIGWYTGLKAKLLQTVLTAAFTFLTYEQILRIAHAVIARRISSVGSTTASASAAYNHLVMSSKRGDARRQP